jgi:TonB family protein
MWRREGPAPVVLATSKRHGVAVVASVVLHGVLTMGPSWASHGSPEPSIVEGVATRPSESTPIGLELPSVAEGLSIEEHAADPVGQPPPPPSGDAVAHPDTERSGRGGQASVKEPALNLADENEQMRLSPDLLSRLDRDQVQRLRAARSRASWEDRRSTTHPAELTLVAVGIGSVKERRALAAMAPSRGAFESPLADVRGGAVGVDAARDVSTDASRAGGDREGSASEAPGAGWREGRPGTDHRASAPVASARPSIVRAPVAVLASERALPRDDLDAQQEVAATVRALVHASTAGGTVGDGNAMGGSEGPGDPGAGGASQGGLRARVLGLPDGAIYDYFSSDPRLVAYFRRIHAKIDPLWANAFPKSALLELEQGTVILEFTVFADGHVDVDWPPRRPSGIDEFDRNCAAAIRRAAPFPPIPSALGSSLRIRAPFVATNPVIK